MTSDDTRDDAAMRLAITITGTRSIGHRNTAEIDAMFGIYLRPYADIARMVYLGGAIGIDTATLAWLTEHASSPLTVVVPALLTDQPDGAQQAVKAARAAGRLDAVVELAAPELTVDAYHARNRYMVDRSEFVIGFPRGDDPRSGTWYTLRYAARHGKPRLIVPV